MSTYSWHLIRAAREAAGMSRAQLGRIVGVSGVQIGRYEDGTNEPSVSIAVAIAEALDLPIEEFVRDRAASSEVIG